MERRMSGPAAGKIKGSGSQVFLVGVLIFHTVAIWAVVPSKEKDGSSILRPDQLLIQTQEHARLRLKVPPPQDPQSTSSAAVVSQGILVKFDAPTADKIEQQLKNGNQAGSQAKRSDSFDAWCAKYKVSGMRRILRGSAGDGRDAVQRMQKISSKKLTGKEQKVFSRLDRVRGDNVIPQPGRTYRIDLEIGEGQTLKEAAEELACQGGVESAQINRTYQLHAPNDPLYPLQWALENTGQIYPPGYAGTAGSDIKAPDAWALHTGDPSVIVAVIDTGLDLAHRDLQENLWINPGEIPDNGADDDGNGYIDDVYGYDFSDEDADPSDYMGHGTHCAGIIAACGNNGLDLSGVVWNAKLMALKMFPLATDEAAFAALVYAADNGADVISCSWGPSGRSPSSPLLEEAVEYAVSMGCIVVFSAGNDNDDVAYYSPANHPQTLAVAATDSRDRKASFSNYGQLIDIAAPGVDILSLRAQGTVLGPIYDDFTVVASGTSMACPQVSGACALFLSIDPSAGLGEIREVLKRTGAEIEDTPTIGRRLDAGAMAQVAAGKGIVYLDRRIYSCSDTITITVIDRDAAGVDTVEAVLAAGGGDQESVFLIPIDPGSFVFRGSLNTSGTAVVLSDGQLKIGHGETIQASYLDAGEEVWISDTAEADCRGPVIDSVDIYAPGPSGDRCAQGSHAAGLIRLNRQEQIFWTVTNLSSADSSPGKLTFSKSSARIRLGTLPSTIKTGPVIPLRPQCHGDRFMSLLNTRRFRRPSTGPGKEMK
jgi:subtilisin family serine protease